jgi:ABC-type bacteriocin/lantibiotic exporter with double-glycine peptidase domain
VSAPPRRWLAPEVVQTSAMDCGPAALKSLLDGHRLPVSYGHLRDICHTDVDGTSIDTIEALAQELGLDAEQVVIPLDHVLLPVAAALPAVVVVRLPHGMTHFAVAWRVRGPLVQVMDPAKGRRWISRARFLQDLYVHQMEVPAADWREWAGTDDAVAPLAARLARLGVGRADRERLIASAQADATWRRFGVLDAATRMVSTLVEAGGLRRGAEATRALDHLAVHSPDTDIPHPFWSVRAADDEGDARLVARGAVLVRVRGLRSTRAEPVPESAAARRLAAAPRDPATGPLHELLRLLRAEGTRSMLAIGGGVFVAMAALLLEVLLLRGLVDLGRDVVVPEQRWAAAGFVLALGVVILGVQFLLASATANLGRRLEGHLRVRLLEKIPRLGDRYFQSRLVSDVAERAHNVHSLRMLPELAGRLARALAELMLTTAALVWLDPKLWLPAVLLAAVVPGIPLLAQVALSEQDLRQRTHAGALTRFYLDGLLGLLAIRAHGAERALRREHGHVLGEWWRAGSDFVWTTTVTEGIQTTLALGLVAWLLVTHLESGGDASSLLVIYWAMRLPVLGDEFAVLMRQYPAMRNVTLRLLEPLTVPDEVAPPSRPAPPTVTADRMARDVAVAFEDVAVHVGGHRILQSVDLSVPAGSHVAIVGPSGAGKSTLVGLLLGWHAPSSGRVLVNGMPLDAMQQENLRRHIAWVDPSVQLWNRSLFDNLRYGSSGTAEPMAYAVDAANLGPLVEKLTDGLRTPLGEGGALVSGGEGQRVRFARALLRPHVTLAVLDEPFRGLDRSTRRAFLEEARRHWKAATLLCVTHDLADTTGFDRVIVMEQGAVVESGEPRALLRTAGSRYAAMVEAERTTREQVWAEGQWRRLSMNDGRITEQSAGASLHAS